MPTRRCGAIDYLLTPTEEKSLSSVIEKALSLLEPQGTLSNDIHDAEMFSPDDVV